MFPYSKKGLTLNNSILVSETNITQTTSNIIIAITNNSQKIQIYKPNYL